MTSHALFVLQILAYTVLLNHYQNDAEEDPDSAVIHLNGAMYKSETCRGCEIRMRRLSMSTLVVVSLFSFGRVPGS